MPRLRLKDLRDLSVIVVHPPDADGKALMDQLKRIGCRAELMWPPAKALPSGTDVVFAGVFFESQSALSSMLRKSEKPGPTVIGIVNYENPAMIELVLDINAFAVISKPVRTFGMLTNLVVARSNWMQAADFHDKIGKLEKKISGQKKISKAKSILMEMHKISEREAYGTIRAQAMGKRISVEEMAVAIINANELLSSRPDDV
ncbi:ANTAR domain-containing protein [Thioclava sediminum]|uniref:ANTAR domain-containing protein n=2 Tax=Thioclava TaxID=285107 RepID=A0ABX6YPG0_9RHOB|nr:MULTISPECIES: ANTAR domain-containing protein [Thioclava]MAQ35691.1 ANTAR domain-containing protein [Thioclava sp.]MPQ94938.1 ANTAR domain-containing protein [Thioclava sp. JE_KL1]OOY04529.1 ANTAR domain-containing protein [Thioclava sp. F28-4]OOY08188.1 ANTAR domain-containing protein [Thioclava sp. F36-7]OOY15359.1 ANTAR domain-containing protein [Thioclava sp. DLFJ4-1]|tara:strand:+ start:1907 stop:2515 length:609 start_codon:yes stop_codon:yes gene_type:complete